MTPKSKKKLSIVYTIVKCLENMVKSKILLETISDKSSLKIQIQSSKFTDTDHVN